MLKGDINNDGLVNQKDAKLLQRAALGTIKLKADELEAADVNNDNKITVEDVIKLREILALRITGDANGDGMLTQDDVKVIQKHIAELLHLDDRLLENADVNGDGQVNMKDVVLLQKLLAGVIADEAARHPK